MTREQNLDNRPCDAVGHEVKSVIPQEFWDVEDNMGKEVYDSGNRIRLETRPYTNMFRHLSILLLLLFTYRLTADASSILPREEAPSNSVDRRSRRALFNIVRGCLSTMIICAWAAIHPNIPPREGPLKATLRRLKLMFWTIVAPEILLAWALRQWFAAMTIRNLYNEKRGVFSHLFQ